MKVFKEIATLAGLQFDVKVTIHHDSTLKREAVQTLLNAGLCSDSDARELGLHPAEQEGSFPVGISIVDTLGEYLSDKREIVIYDVMCRLAATKLCVDVEALKQVVIVHEIAHAVTHLGRDSDSRIWEYFSIAETKDKELFAQIYPLLYFKTTKNHVLEDIFRELAKHQDELYNSWRHYEEKELSEINDELMKVRLKRLKVFLKEIATLPDLIIELNSVGYSINMNSANDINAKMLGDGRIFLMEQDWLGLPSFSSGLGKQAPRRVSPETLMELRRVIEKSEIMRIPSQTFGPSLFLDGSTTNLSIKLGGQRRDWLSHCGVWAPHESIFREIEQLFRMAVAESTFSKECEFRNKESSIAQEAKKSMETFLKTHKSTLQRFTSGETQFIVGDAFYFDIKNRVVSVDFRWFDKDPKQILCAVLHETLHSGREEPIIGSDCDMVFEIYQEEFEAVGDALVKKYREKFGESHTDIIKSFENSISVPDVKRAWEELTIRRIDEPRIRAYRILLNIFYDMGVNKKIASIGYEDSR